MTIALSRRNLLDHRIPPPVMFLTVAVGMGTAALAAGLVDLVILRVRKSVLAVGIAFASAALFGVSFALGAFFAGMVMRESPLAKRAAEESLPLRDAFSVLFFVSVGMLLNPLEILDMPVDPHRMAAAVVAQQCQITGALFGDQNIAVRQHQQPARVPQAAGESLHPRAGRAHRRSGSVRRARRRPVRPPGAMGAR